MSLLANALRQTLPRVPDRLEQLSALIDPTWIAQALGTSGKASIRRRKLPAEHAVWLVIGLALFRDRPLWQVEQQLDLSLDGQALPAPSVSVNDAFVMGAWACAATAIRCWCATARW